jgi:hypothetical protein
MAVGLAISGIAELSSIWLLDVARLFPLPSIVAHSLTRIGIALVLAYLEHRLLFGRARLAEPGSRALGRRALLASRLGLCLDCRPGQSSPCVPGLLFSQKTHVQQYELARPAIKAR